MSDLIDRQALKQAMYHEAFEADTEMQKWDGGCWIRYKLFEKIVDILPAVQPKQKTGRWIIHIPDLFPAESTMECSNCKHEQPLIIDDSYCPNCGAKMESDNNDS